MKVEGKGKALKEMTYHVRSAFHSSDRAALSFPQELPSLILGKSIDMDDIICVSQEGRHTVRARRGAS